ncbi:unnamed protein product, partial [Brenthis ino]
MHHEMDVVYACRRHGVSAHILRLIAPPRSDGWTERPPAAPHPHAVNPTSTRVVPRNSIIVRLVSFDNTPTVNIRAEGFWNSRTNTLKL